MATVYNATTGKNKTVKNLGWLIRHANEVKYVELTPQHWFKETKKGYEARMRVVLNNGDNFTTEWGSKKMCCQWLKNRRSKLATCPLFCF